MNADGSDPFQLAKNKSSNSGARWSPDGEKIVFASDRDGDYDIYAMNSDGSSVKNITNNNFKDIQPTWLNPIKK